MFDEADLASINHYFTGIGLSDGATMIIALLDVWAAPFVLLGLGFFIIEIIKLWKNRGFNKRRTSGMLTSLFCVLPATVVELLAGGVLLGVFYTVALLAPWSLPISWGSALVCLLLVDFTYYWEHRLAHRINVLWSSYHAVHHSADHYDQSVALRVSFVDFFITPWFYLPLLLMGLQPLLVLVCFALVIAYQTWLHTELVGRLRWLDGWLNTPSNHRVHHGRNPRYLDKNYGGVLIIWDRLFGTYEPETETVDYGLVEPLHSRNPLAVHFGGMRSVLQSLAAASGFKACLSVLFGPPAAQQR